MPMPVGMACRRNDGKMEAADAPASDISACLATLAERSASDAPPSAAEMEATAGRGRFNELLSAFADKDAAAPLMSGAASLFDADARTALASKEAGRVTSRSEPGAAVPALDEEDADEIEDEDEDEDNATPTRA